MNKKNLISLLITLALSACTRSLTYSAQPAATVTPTLSFDTPVPGAGNGTALAPGGYAVIRVLKDDVLTLRSGPGEDYSAVGTLGANQTGLTRTGRNSNVGEETWVEVRGPGGETGWVDDEFLTERVTPSTFCGDMRVTQLLRDLETAVEATDGEAFMALVSPAHGMDVVYIRGGMVANYTPEEANWAFQSTYEVNWGLGAGSGEPVNGTFPEVILPALQDVFTNITYACDEIVLGGTTYEVTWPVEYTNINFYALHKPGSDSFGSLDWRTWLVGVEYVDGQPYLFALLNYQWEP